MQARNRPARRSGPTNTEYHWDYEQCCNVALRHSVISPKTPGKIRLNGYALSERTALVFSTQGSASLHPGL